jgi:YbbR domain-containing protein
VTWLRTTGLRLLLAIGLGFALWVFVSYTQNPDRDTSYDSVPVNIVGRAPNLILVDKDGLPRSSLPPVNVTVQADTETLKNVQQSSLRALVDLTGLEAGEHQVPIDVEPTRADLKRVTFSTKPSFLPIRLEQEITRTVALTVEVTGSVPFSFEAGRPRLTHLNQPIDSVQVRGPQSRVEQVKFGRISADIDRLTANYDSPRPIVAIGQDGQEVDGVVFVPANVNVLVPIGSSAGIKRVPVVPQLVGTPASGYIVTGIAVEPQFIRRTGATGALDNVQSVGTTDVEISGQRQTVVRTAEVRAPPNIGIVADETTTVTVTVNIQPITQPFQITLPAPVVITDLPADLLFSLSPQNVQVTLAGTAAQLSNFNPNSLQGTVSLRGRGPGTYTLVPSFNLPAGITLAGQPPTVTVSLRLPSTATPNATATPDTTPTESPGSPTPPSPPEAAPTGTAPTTAPPAAPPEPTAAP